MARAVSLLAGARRVGEGTRREARALRRRVHPGRSVAAAALALLVGPAPSLGFERIAVVAPLGDRHAVLGEQAVRGAREALGLPRESNEGAGGEAPDDEGGVELVTVSDPCRGGERSAEDGAAIAQGLIEADADAVVGLICWSSLEPALREGTLDGLPMITSGVRAGALTDRRRAEGWDVWRVAPRVEDEGEAVARHILRAWRDRPYAILDDGTIYGRELAERVTLELGERGSEPVLAETFRPAISRQFGLARRLDGSGASHVFVAGERRDIAILARDAAAAGLDLTILGGDAMRAVDDDVSLLAGVEAIVLAPALADGYRATTRAAVETLLQAEELALERGFSLEDALNTGEFDTAIGSVRFDRLGDLRRNLFEHAVWNGERWVVTSPDARAALAPQTSGGLRAEAEGGGGTNNAGGDASVSALGSAGAGSGPPASADSAAAANGPADVRQRAEPTTDAGTSRPRAALPATAVPAPAARPARPAPLNVVPLDAGSGADAE